MSCTVVDNTNYCASAASSAIRTGPEGIVASGVSETETSKSSGLSTGAKAGIGVGVALGACVLVGALLWFCVVHRRNARAKMSQHESSAPALSQVSGSKADTNRPNPGPRSRSDYFGPSAKAGPFTDDMTSFGASPGANSRGVPLSPDSPVDISAAVEIDSRDYSNVTSPGYINEYMKGTSATGFPIELP